MRIDTALTLALALAFAAGLALGIVACAARSPDVIPAASARLSIVNGQQEEARVYQELGPASRRLVTRVPGMGTERALVETRAVPWNLYIELWPSGATWRVPMDWLQPGECITVTLTTLMSDNGVLPCRSP